MSSRMQRGSALIGAIACLLGCGPPAPRDNDPLQAFGLYGVAQVGTYAYAWGSFYSEPRRTAPGSALVVVPVQSVLVDHDPIRNSRLRRSETPNVAVWNMGDGLQVIGRSGDGLLAVDTSASASGGAVTLRFVSVAEPLHPALTLSRTLTGTEGMILSSATEIEPWTFLASFQYLGAATPPGSYFRLVVMRMGAAAIDVVSETPGLRCSAGAVVGSVLACSGWVDNGRPEAPAPENLHVLNYASATGVGTLVRSSVVSELGEASAASGHGNAVLFVDARGLVNVSIDAAGTATAAARLPIPMVRGATPRVSVVRDRGDGVLVVGTNHGLVLLDGTTGALVADSAVDLPVRTVVASQSRWLVTHGEEGVSLFDIAAASATRVGTYHRSFSTDVLTYGAIRESAY